MKNKIKIPMSLDFVTSYLFSADLEFIIINNALITLFGDLKY